MLFYDPSDYLVDQYHSLANLANNVQRLINNPCEQDAALKSLGDHLIKPEGIADATTFTESLLAPGLLGGGVAAAEETVTLYHGTTSSAARNILNGGFRAGADNAVFLGEDFSTARFFGESRIAETGAKSGQVLRYTMPQSLAEELGLTSRQVLGEFRGAPPIDIPGGSGFERIMTGRNIDAFNQAVKAGQISVKPIRIEY
jgi:hypothetical protein